MSNAFKITFFDAKDNIVQVMTTRDVDGNRMTRESAEITAANELSEGFDCPGAVRYEVEELEGAL